MSSVKYIKCKCGNQEMTSDYHYKTEELYESCDVCGYYRHVKLTNRFPDGKYPDNWRPIYDIKEGNTGYVVKIFNIDLEGFSVCFCEEKDLEELINNLENDDNVDFFGITHKGKNGYKTQLFKI